MVHAHAIQLTKDLYRKTENKKVFNGNQCFNWNWITFEDGVFDIQSTRFCYKTPPVFLGNKTFNFDTRFIHRKNSVSSIREKFLTKLWSRFKRSNTSETNLNTFSSWLSRVIFFPASLLLFAVDDNFKKGEASPSFLCSEETRFDLINRYYSRHGYLCLLQIFWARNSFRLASGGEMSEKL